MLYQIKNQCLANDTEPNDLDNMFHSLTKRSLHYQCTIQDFHLQTNIYPERVKLNLSKKNLRKPSKITGCMTYVVHRGSSIKRKCCRNDQTNDNSFFEYYFFVDVSNQESERSFQIYIIRSVDFSTNHFSIRFWKCSSSMIMFV